MIRPVKFRAKDMVTEKWHVGFLIRAGVNQSPYIVNDNPELGSRIGFAVLEESIGEFTGLLDSTSYDKLSEDEKKLFREDKLIWRGREIFENDIVFDVVNEMTGTIAFIEGAFRIHWSDDVENGELVLFLEDIEVIGNLFDNSYLLDSDIMSEGD